MGKKKDKKSKVTAEPTLSKKERKAAEKRAAELEAELERRAAKKAKKKGGKKGKKSKAEKPEKARPAAEVEAVERAKAKRAEKKAKSKSLGIERRVEVGLLTREEADSLSEVEAKLLAESREDAAAMMLAAKKGKSKRDEVIDPETGKTRPEVVEARAAEREATQADLDAEIKARVQSKRDAREKGKRAVEAEAESIDRADDAAVKAYNIRAAAVGATLLTSDAEREKIAKRGDAKIEALGKEGIEAIVSDRVTVTEVSDADVIEKAEAAVEALGQAIEAVETEHGREFQVGASVNADPAEEFAKPSDAAPLLESGRNGYKIIQLDKDGNPDPRVVRQYTRVTTYVDNIDDKTALNDWEKRLLAEGLAAGADDLLPKIADVVHRRDVAYAKAEKADRKGKLQIGELARLTDAAKKEAKKALDEIVREALDLAGRDDKANAGTHLHTLAEIADERGIDAIREMFENPGEGNPGAIPVTANDLASIEAYVDAMQRLGAENIVSEAIIVDDVAKRAGRFDALKFAKLPEIVDPKTGEIIRPADVRRRRYIFDVKTGNLDFSGGKISRQMTAYALGDLYDPKTGIRTASGAARDVALVVHLPVGTGECHVYVVDLKNGAQTLKVAESVRAARNTGRKAINTAVDLAAPAAATESEED